MDPAIDELGETKSVVENVPDAVLAALETWVVRLEETDPVD